MKLRRREVILEKQEISWDEFSTHELEQLQEIVENGLEFQKSQKDTGTFLTMAIRADVARGHRLLAKVEHERNRRRFG